jgi:hypothetical protein
MGKASPADYDFRWITLQAYDGTLDASDQLAGSAPVADGIGGWSWAFPYVDWSATPGQQGFIDNKPLLGTAALYDEEYFATAAHVHSAADVTTGVLDKARVPRVIDLRGITVGTAVPTGGASGDLYLRKL